MRSRIQKHRDWDVENSIRSWSIANGNVPSTIREESVQILLFAEIREQQVGGLSDLGQHLQMRLGLKRQFQRVTDPDMVSVIGQVDAPLNTVLDPDDAAVPVNR